MKASISIITVCYNDRENLKKTITSVRKQTSLTRIEFVIVDGGSEDNTLDVINDNTDIIDLYISEKDNGIYNAMNKGLSLASSEYVIFLNAGDVFYNASVIELVLEEISNDKKFDIYYSNAIYYNNEDSDEMQADHYNILHKMPFNHQSTIINRELNLKYLYSESYIISSDYDFFIKAYKNKSSFKKLNTIIARHHLDGISVTSPFHSCVESVHSHLMNFGNIEFKKTEYYGEIFIREIFLTSPRIGNIVHLLYDFFVKKNRRQTLKVIKNRFFK